MVFCVICSEAAMTLSIEPTEADMSTPASPEKWPGSATWAGCEVETDAAQPVVAAQIIEATAEHARLTASWPVPLV
jgi:hypothetical protein